MSLKASPTDSIFIAGILKHHFDAEDSLENCKRLAAELLENLRQSEKTTLISNAQYQQELIRSQHKIKKLKKKLAKQKAKKQKGQGKLDATVNDGANYLPTHFKSGH